MSVSEKYLTTTQASKICNVTRFTIANWVKIGKLKSSVTAGGHRRILQKDLASFTKKNRLTKLHRNGSDKSGSLRTVSEKHDPQQKKIDSISPPSNKDIAIPHCWEFSFKEKGAHSCINCLVFKEGANKCFLLTKQFGSEKVQCHKKCHDCEYLRQYYPAKLEALQGKKGLVKIPVQVSLRGKDKPEFVKKGMYASGKYVASIKRVFTKKLNEGRLA